MRRQYSQAMVHPGESVGILAACSMGEKHTQTALDSFHTAGKSEKAVTTGISRFLEIMNATKIKNQKNISTRIYFLPEAHPQSLQTLRQHCPIFEGITLIQLCSNDTNAGRVVTVAPDWFSLYCCLYNATLPPTFYTKSDGPCLRYTINAYIMVKYNLSLSHIANVLRTVVGVKAVVVSPRQFRAIDVFYTASANIADIETTVLFGHSDITNVYYSKCDVHNEWVVETEGSNYEWILSQPLVDTKRTVSNNVWEIYEAFGIEAARQFIIDEFIKILEGIYTVHVEIVADRMCHMGSLHAISRYTMRDDRGGVLGRASFEESLDHLCHAAFVCETDPLSDVSSSIICGKRIKRGTGIFDLFPTSFSHHN